MRVIDLREIDLRCSVCGRRRGLALRPLIGVDVICDWCYSWACRLMDPAGRRGRVLLDLHSA